MVRYVRTLGVDGVCEELDGSHVIARQQDATRLFQALLHQGQGHRVLRYVTAGLFFTIVRVEVYVTAWLGHAVTCRSEDNYYIYIENKYNGP